MKEQLISFYLQGRGVDSLARLRKFVDDPDEIAEKIRAGADVRAAVSAACEAASSQIAADRKRRDKWMEENRDELVTADKTEAWKAYCQGMADELAYSMEPDVLDALEGDYEDDDDGDEGEEEEDKAK